MKSGPSNHCSKAPPKTPLLQLFRELRTPAESRRFVQNFLSSIMGSGASAPADVVKEAGGALVAGASGYSSRVGVWGGEYFGCFWRVLVGGLGSVNQ